MSAGWRRSVASADAVGWLSIYLVLLFFVPSRLILGPLGSAGAPSMVFGLASLLLWFLIHLRPGRRGTLRAHPIRITLFGFLFSVGVSYLLAMSEPLLGDERSPADVAVLALLSWSGTLLLAQDGVDERERLEQLLWRVVLCGGAIAALGLIQIATRRLWVDELAIPGLTGSPSYGLTSRGGFPRPAGTAIHPIEYGVILAMMFPLAWHVAFFHTQRATWLRFCPALLLSAVIPLTSSRSAYLGCLIGLVVCLIGWPKRRRLAILAFITAGSLMMTVVTPNFVNSVTQLFTGAGSDPSIESRTNGYALAGEFIDRKFWFGRGLGTFLPRYQIFDNEYLLLLVTVGVVGTLVFLSIGLTAVAVAWCTRRSCRDATGRDLAMSLSAAVLAGFTCLFMFDAFAFPMTMGTLFLILGMVGCLHRMESTAHADTRTYDESRDSSGGDRDRQLQQ